MLSQDILDKIEPLISTKKVALYRKNKDDLVWFESYKCELYQAKEVFVYLHFLEIFLRNKITIEFSIDFGEWLFDSSPKLQFNSKEKDKIDQLMFNLKKSNKKLDIDNFVSNLSFGFWTNLFHRPYAKIWKQNKMIERVFPFLKNHQRNIIEIQKELEFIRRLRNRIFHFESLQSLNFEEAKQLVNKFIYGISGIEIAKILDNM